MSLALWQQCLDYLQDELNSQQFNTWIKHESTGLFLFNAYFSIRDLFCLARCGNNSAIMFMASAGAKGADGALGAELRRAVSRPGRHGASHRPDAAPEQARFTHLPLAGALAMGVGFLNVTQTGVNTTDVIDAYTLLDAKIGMVHDGWQVEVFGTNLTDEEYYTSLVSSLTSLGAAPGVAGSPRVIGLSVSREF